MISAHVVNALNKHLYENEFDEFLRRRHDFFVHQKRWRPPSPDGRELDQFDTDAATYLLGMEEGRVVTSARLIPTSEPHMVSEVFPHMCERTGVPRRPDWAEWTRTFVVPDKRDRASRHANATVLRGDGIRPRRGPERRRRCPGNLLHAPPRRAEMARRATRHGQGRKRRVVHRRLYRGERGGAGERAQDTGD